ncbi:MAG TPA: hypothetical protein VMN58_11115 [Acidimicrobiales bacterium]|nr:hypothetical protein [Acidimicrobiales bacterium]
MWRQVLGGIALVVVAGCTGDEPPMASDSARPSVPSANAAEGAFDHELVTEDFRATVRCGASHGPPSMAEGSFENRSDLTAAFQVWVVWRANGSGVDVSSGPTGVVAPGETGTWMTQAPTASVDDCEVGCVMPIDPGRPNDAAENCSGAPF